MNIVIDTSALLAIVTNEASKAQLISVTYGTQLLVPPSVHWEVGNAFSAMLKRGRISLLQAQEALVYYQQIPLRQAPIALSEALQIAYRLNIYAYDAYLLCCAEKYRAPLLTLDQGLRYAAQQQQIALIEV
ncbi:MAG: type II toxin-antitoxin system VapC family toxin [Anaerolineales bacterium]|nr:type II toxin-antitoxin system VapC family toxin [Anaerolineales bacterium]